VRHLTHTVFNARRAPGTLLLGTANPSGEDRAYNGLYFRHDELAGMVDTNALRGIPVKAEHTGSGIGSVVSAFLDGSGALQCVLEIDDSVQGAIASALVRNGIAADLSMGYAVAVQHSGATDRLVAGQKNTLEVSLVRRGAREGCHIHAYQETEPDLAPGLAPGPAARQRGIDATWAAFDLG
jgi:hypothetical protein